MELLGPGPAELRLNDPDAKVMADGGYWVTDFQALFTDGAVFRDGAWVQMKVGVHRLGELRCAKPSVLTISEVGYVDETLKRFARRVPSGTHGLFASVDKEGDLLATVLQFGPSPVVDWSPALFEGEPVPKPPLLVMFQMRGSDLVIGFEDQPAVKKAQKKVVPQVKVLGTSEFAVAASDTYGKYQSYWGWDAKGEVTAFVTDFSEQLLRESAAKESDFSSPRIHKNPASLARRLKHLVERGALELESGATVEQVAKAFLAQPEGNLRDWLVDAPHVAEVFF